MPPAPVKRRLAKARDAVLKIADSFPGLHVAVESIGDQVVITLRELPARKSRSSRDAGGTFPGGGPPRIRRGGVVGRLPAPVEVIAAIAEHYGGLTLTDVAYRFGVRPRGRLKPVLEALVAQGRLEKVVNRFRVPGTVRPYRTRKRYLATRRGASRAPLAPPAPARPRVSRRAD